MLIDEQQQAPARPAIQESQVQELCEVLRGRSAAMEVLELVVESGEEGLEPSVGGMKRDVSTQAISNLVRFLRGKSLVQAKRIGKRAFYTATELGGKVYESLSRDLVLTRHAGFKGIVIIKHSLAPTGFVLNLEKALKSVFEDRGHQLTTLVESTLPPALNVFRDFAYENAEFLIVATEADTETGWFRDQVGTGQRKKKSAVVVFFGEVDPDILKVFGGINFTPAKEDNRRAFRSLCAHFGVEVRMGQSVDDLKPSLYSREILPPVGIKSGTFHEDLFRHLQTTATVILLAQAGRSEKPFVRQIINRATVHYGESCVLHISPPSSLDVTSDELFEDLGERCGFDGVKRQYDWERALKRKIAEEGRLFLLLSRFEHASNASQDSIAKVLRGVSDELDWARLHVVVCGGRRLVEQKFLNGNHSLLNHAYPVLFPDLEIDDLIDWTLREAPELELTHENAVYLLTRYGAHPGLLQYALGALRQRRSGDEFNLVETVRKRESLGWYVQYFLPYKKNEKDKRAVCEYLKKPEALGRFGFWHHDEIVRRLFWDNLLTRDGDMLRWRSESIVNAGLEILRCDSREA